MFDLERSLFTLGVSIFTPQRHSGSQAVPAHASSETQRRDVYTCFLLLFDKLFFLPPTNIYTACFIKAEYFRIFEFKLIKLYSPYADVENRQALKRKSYLVVLKKYNFIINYLPANIIQSIFSKLKIKLN